VGFPSLARIANGFNALICDAIRVSGGSPALSVLVYDEDEDAFIPQSPSVFGITLPGAFGDGHDGAVHYTTNTTLTEDVRATTIIVDSGVTVNQAGFLQLATVSITNDGTIADDGADASGATPGAARSADCTCQVAGGNGGARATQGGDTVTTGFNGQGTAEALGASGGAGGGGGAGIGGTNNSWDLVTTTSSPFASTNPLFVVIPDLVYINLLVTVGAGGGGGTATTGGTGGAGGGMVRLGSPLITNNGTIRAKGGNGSDGTAAGGGGGGGGGGGRIVIAGGIAVVGTMSVAGGTGGAGNGGGAAGSNGSTGTIHLFV
jgi:hypothetical protein